MPASVLPSTPQHDNPAAGPLAPWLEAAQRGAVTVTSNQRASRFLQAQMRDLSLARGSAGWPTPAILTWNGWLSSEWQRVTLQQEDAPILLSNEQVHALWRQIIAGSGSSSPFAHDSLANLAQKAWTLLHDYAIDLTSVRRAARLRVDWEQFSKWADRLQARLQKEHWTTEAQLAGELNGRLRAAQWRPPSELIAWGFDAFTPAQESLLQSLAHHCQLTRIDPSFCTLPRQSVSAVSLGVGSRADEFRAAARWARLRLEKEPSARLAIIATKVADDRGALQRALSLELASSDFAFTLGRPFAHFPMVRTALLLLEFQRGWLTAGDVSDLLLAPELAASPEERDERALFEANVFRRRDDPDPTMDLASFTRWLRGAIKPGSTSLGKLLRRCEAVLRLLPKKHFRMGAEDWAEQFSQSLAAYCFPANTLNSAEYQTWDRWQKLLQAFASTAVSGETLSHADALARLSHMAGQATFQPESPDAPVEIMGPLEAAGSLFDGVFFIGCTDDRWPLGTVPNALLPLALQRAAGVPGAAAGSALERGLKMTERILNSAPEVFFSHAQRNKDGELRPSPVLSRMQVGPASARLYDELLPAIDRREPALDQLDDAFGPVWPLGSPALSTSALKSQAACPFQAFALHRLHARGQDLPEEGFDAMQRGSFLHTALQQVWCGPQGLKTSCALHELIDSGGLEKFVKQCVDDSLPTAAGGWQREYFQIERERLCGLICDWLVDVESKRPPFEVIETESERKQVPFPGLPLTFHVRPDRVDELVAPEGADHKRELILLDYKTGEVDNKQWLTPRMDEPQLPFYALFVLPEAPVAVALASIRSGEKPCIKAVAAREDILPGSKPMKINSSIYQANLEQWRSDLELLAKEFVEGNAVVAPKHGDKTCKYCTLQPLCRVNETAALRNESDDADHDNEGAESNG